MGSLEVVIRPTLCMYIAVIRPTLCMYIAAYDDYGTLLQVCLLS